MHAYLLHVVPVGDDTVLEGVLEGEDAPLALGLVSHVGILLSYTDHHALVAGATHDGGKEGAGRVVSIFLEALAVCQGQYELILWLDMFFPLLQYHC